MFVCCVCCVLSGRGLWDELITRPGESYWLWCVVVCDLETSKMRRPRPALGRSATKKKKKMLVSDQRVMYKGAPLTIMHSFRQFCCVNNGLIYKQQYLQCLTICLTLTILHSPQILDYMFRVIVTIHFHSLYIYCFSDGRILQCLWATVWIYIGIYRVSQEECARLRESVPYVKVHRYNRKHLYPKLNGYWDNGQRKVWFSCGSTYCTC
jgi:hypothetical protein